MPVAGFLAASTSSLRLAQFQSADMTIRTLFAKTGVFCMAEWSRETSRPRNICYRHFANDGQNIVIKDPLEFGL